MLIQAHHLLARLVTVVLPAETDLTLRKVDQTIVGDGHPMRVTSEILEDVLGATQWWLGVNDPVGFPYRSQIPGKSAGVLKWFKRVEETQVPGVKGRLQLC